MIRILYVDDEEMLLDVCREFLQQSGDLIVETTTSAQEALLKMAMFTYDAVISDYQMPEMNGIDFLKLTRSSDDPIPFILFTGRGREEVVIEALNSGADFYLQKGGDPSSQFRELEHKVKEAVRRNRAENALKLNEARLNKAQTIGLTGCWEISLDNGTHCLWGSEESFRIFGVPHLNDEPVGLSLIEGRIIEREYTLQALRDLVERDTKFDIEVHVMPSNGGPTRIVRSMAELVRDKTGRPAKVVGVIQDITERKLAEKRLQRLNRDLLAIKECNKAMIRATTEQELVSDICNIVCNIAGYRGAWIGMAENDEAKSVRPIAWSGLGKGNVENARVTWGDDERGRGTMGTAIKTASTVISRHLQDDPSMRPWRETLIELGYCSVTAIPMVNSGVAFGALAIYIDDPEGFSYEEIDLLEEMTGDLAFGILGLRVKERQARAEEEQRRSEERFRTIFTEAPVAMCLSLGGEIQQCNRRFLELFKERSERSFENFPLEDLVTERERERFHSLLEEGRSKGYLDTTTTGLRGDGTEFALSAIFTSVAISDKVTFLGFFSDTTERERMQSMIKESEIKHRMFIECSPLAFALTGTAGLILEVNPAYCALLGYEPKDVIGRHPAELMSPEDREILKANIPLLMSHGTGSMNCNLRRKDGRYFPVHVFSTNLPNGNTMAFIEDIAERMEFQEGLKRNEENYRTIFDRAALGMVTSDLEGRPLDFNQRFIEMLGYSPEEIRGMRFSQISHPDNLTKDHDLFVGFKEGDLEAYDMETKVVRKDGSIIWIHMFATKLVDPMGRLDRILSIMEDITERRTIGESLRKSEEEYSKLVAAIPDFVIRTVRDGTVVLINDAALTQSGYRRDEVVGRNMLSFIAPEDFEKTIKNTEAMMSGKLGPVEYHLLMKDGRRLLIEANGDVLRDPSGTPTGMVYVCRDLTERRRLETKLREANRKLRVMDGITRHDSMNKLMALQGYIDLMRNDEVDPKDLDRLMRMERIVEFLTDQVNATKEYQNIGVGDPEWQSIRRVCMHAASLANLDKVSFKIDVGDLEILADPLLYKVFYNLMDNSMRHGMVVDRIWVNKEQVGDDVCISLNDNGIGISLEDKANLFKEGYGKVHGLGLFLSREILDITGITIKETGEPGKGARFEIRVPKDSFRVPTDLPAA